MASVSAESHYSVQINVHWIKGIKEWDNVIMKPVVIEDRSWVGLNSIILKGIRIGEGAVVSAGSVVTKNVPPYTVVGGNPAKILKRIIKNNKE